MPPARRAAILPRAIATTDLTARRPALVETTKRRQKRRVCPATRSATAPAPRERQRSMRTATGARPSKPRPALLRHQSRGCPAAPFHRYPARRIQTDAKPTRPPAFCARLRKPNSPHAARTSGETRGGRRARQNVRNEKWRRLPLLPHAAPETSSERSRTAENCLARAKSLHAAPESSRRAEPP